jgi:23S rRNA pseudouridine1911/1915/1917 synthase
MLSEENLDDNVDQDSELYEHFSIEVDKGQTALRIDKFLSIKMPNASRNRIQNAIEAASVLVNGQPVKSSYKVKALDLIQIVLAHPPRDTEIKPENIPLNIVYEDDDVILINKPAGMVVHPGYNNYTGTLVNALAFHFDNMPQLPGNEGRPGLVHRIDKNTSGLLIIGKNEYSLNFLAKQFYEHSIERTYLALAWGSVPESGSIEGYIGRSLKDRKIQAIYNEEQYGKWTKTHYKCLEDLHYVSLVECKLETGRTHQIRAHFKHLGHPLFNDETYGGDKILKGMIFSKYEQFVKNAFDLLPRQALHAKTLGFIHPRTKKKMFFDTELPEDFNLCLNKWRNYHSTQTQS